jgi:nucleoside-diphosphate-sugar epimerase
MQNRIVITGTFGHVGRVLLHRLWECSIEPYALTRRPVAFRGRRVIVDSLNGDRAQKAIHQADVVIHLAGTLNPKSSDTYYGSNVATAAAVARAAHGSTVKRIIMLSPLGSSEFSTNELLRTRARAERILLETRIPTVIFRCSHIIGDPARPGFVAGMFLSRDLEPVKILGTGRQIAAPVYAGDVVQAIVSAVDNGRSGVFELSGPDRMSLDDLARLLNHDQNVPLRHLPERLAKFLPAFLPGVPPALVDLMMRPSAGNPAEAVRVFGVQLHSLREIWGSTAPKNGPMFVPSEGIEEVSC